jgi:membrane protease YdiL (CAAX protease family)
MATLADTDAQTGEPDEPGQLAETQESATLDLTAPQRRALRNETLIVLGMTLGASAISSILRIIERLTRPEPLGSQTSTINSSVTPDRPWLDFLYAFVNQTLPLVPVLLVLYLLTQVARPSERPLRLMGLDCTRPWRDLGWAFAIAAGIGIPGLAFYVFSKAIGINTTVVAANMTENWWTIPVYIWAAFRAGMVEETIMVGYLTTRWQQIGWGAAHIVITSALIRGTYHLYQGFGGFIGNAIMGAAFGWLYLRTHRLWILIMAHTLLDIVSFVGYALLHDYVTWL